MEQSGRAIISGLDFEGEFLILSWADTLWCHCNAKSVSSVADHYFIIIENHPDKTYFFLDKFNLHDEDFFITSILAFFSKSFIQERT